MLHADERYGHQAGEINFWMPLTDYKLTRTSGHFDRLVFSACSRWPCLEPAWLGRRCGSSLRQEKVTSIRLKSTPVMS